MDKDKQKTKKIYYKTLKNLPVKDHITQKRKTTKKIKIILLKKIITQERKIKWNRKENDKQMVHKMLKWDRNSEKNENKENEK